MYRFATKLFLRNPFDSDCRACQLAEEFRGERTVNEHGHGAVSISSSLNDGSGSAGGRDAILAVSDLARRASLARSPLGSVTHEQFIYIKRAERAT